jgi:hypothetical protein
MNVPQIAAFNLAVQFARPQGPGEVYNYIGPQSDPANKAKVDANRAFTCGAMGGSGNLACHEFPYASLLQGGTGNGLGGPPAVGGLVNAGQNSTEGGYWSSWVVAMMRAGRLAPGGPLRILNIPGGPGGGNPPQP